MMSITVELTEEQAGGRNDRGLGGYGREWGVKAGREFAVKGAINQQVPLSLRERAGERGNY